MTVSRSLGLLAASSLIAGAAVASTDPVNVNEAGIDRLQQLNGVGPATAEAIIQDREENGPFERIDAMTRVNGIGEATLESLRESVTLD
ncbi:competence protein ComEA [Spiribacter aquaticus]|uniref:Competence protein ComEA n=1 Tax=Spiribacter aquaticus TaxID=1935996 RepID=A0A557RJP6_9GAMM|nr:MULTISPECIES: helix-hairpin-helix domain-containing protein [Spiribacter]TVO65388.1 competence protein ComEA [Spiribacter aquaticus]